MKKTLIILTIMLGLTSYAQANPNNASTPKNAQEKYTQMDKNADGKVTAEEFKALYPTMQSNVFGIIDANNDKVISLKEWNSFQEQHMQGMKSNNQGKASRMTSPTDTSGRIVDGGSQPNETHPGGRMLIIPPSN